MTTTAVTWDVGIVATDSDFQFTVANVTPEREQRILAAARARP